MCKHSTEHQHKYHCVCLSFTPILSPDCVNGDIICKLYKDNIEAKETACSLTWNNLWKIIWMKNHL